MFKIGNIKVNNPLFLAPMAGITDHPFRTICKRFGAGLVYTEFVSADGIIRENEKTLNMIKFTDEERPIGVQIFGDQPEVVSKSAKYICQTFKPDLIDINYGCPVPKVTKKGAGSAALKDLCIMKDITEAVVESVPNTPVTVKMRAGWNSDNIVSTKAGILLEEVGVKAIALHGRTTSQLFKGKANLVGGQGAPLSNYFVKNNLDSLITVHDMQVHCNFKNQPVNYDKDELFAQTQDLIKVQPFVYSIMMWQRETFLSEFTNKGHALFCGRFETYPVQKISGIIIKTAEDLKLADLLMRSINLTETGYSVEYDELVNNEYK